MQSNLHHPQASVVLKDGTLPLATWTQSFDPSPTIGEPVAIPSHVLADLEGYGTQATVSRIQLQENLPVRIELDATCQMKSNERPVIVLNSNRIPDSRQETVVTHLRNTLRFPLISWEPGTEADPVIRFHDPASGRQSLLPSIRSGLFDLIHETASV